RAGPLRQMGEEGVHRVPGAEQHRADDGGEAVGADARGGGEEVRAGVAYEGVDRANSGDGAVAPGGEGVWLLHVGGGRVHDDGLAARLGRLQAEGAGLVEELRAPAADRDVSAELGEADGRAP